MKKNNEENIKNENNNKENKMIMILIIAIIVIIVLVCLILKVISKGNEMVSSKDISNLLSESKEAIIYINSNDKKKCESCSKVKERLDKKKINYYYYEVEKNTKDDYNDMLKSLNINPDDFNYPAIIYIKDNFMYANVININDTKVVDQFIKDYNLDKIQK